MTNTTSSTFKELQLAKSQVRALPAGQSGAAAATSVGRAAADFKRPPSSFHPPPNGPDLAAGRPRAAAPAPRRARGLRQPRARRVPPRAPPAGVAGAQAPRPPRVFLPRSHTLPRQRVLVAAQLQQARALAPRHGFPRDGCNAGRRHQGAHTHTHTVPHMYTSSAAHAPAMRPLRVRARRRCSASATTP